MWRSFQDVVAVPEGVFGVTVAGGARYLIRRPLASESVAGLVKALPPGGRVIVEDPYGAPPAVVPGTTVLRMPVMTRAPADVEQTPRPDTTVGAVSDPAALAEAERVMVDGFPFPHLQPWQAGRALPARVLQLPGWRVWLARRGGVPAAACYTYDDGTAVGVYWLATLAEHRSTGLGSVVMNAALAAHRGRAATLVATEAGIPLYRRLNFTVTSTATWYIRGS
jgi:GNAT superfamily N-acetyltransferase